MSTCPKCNRKLKGKRGEKIVHEATKYRPEIVAYAIIWICPVHGETKSNAELMAMGAIDRVAREVS